MLLSVSDLAGAELAENARNARIKIQDAEFIKSLIDNDRYSDPELWSRVRAETFPVRRMIAMVARYGYSAHASIVLS
jgi:hypothetical protein